MRFARIAYGVAAAYGFLTLTPLYFMVGKIGHDAPPSITHPEFYYGFVGVALLWQMIFVLIARDPIRYRSIMPITILEKLVYTVPVVLLYLQGQVHAEIRRVTAHAGHVPANQFDGFVEIRQPVKR